MYSWKSVAGITIMVSSFVGFCFVIVENWSNPLLGVTGILFACGLLSGTLYGLGKGEDK